MNFKYVAPFLAAFIFIGACSPYPLFTERKYRNGFYFHGLDGVSVKTEKTDRAKPIDSIRIDTIHYDQLIKTTESEVFCRAEVDSSTHKLLCAKDQSTNDSITKSEQPRPTLHQLYGDSLSIARLDSIDRRKAGLELLLVPAAGLLSVAAIGLIADTSAVMPASFWIVLCYLLVAFAILMTILALLNIQKIRLRRNHKEKYTGRIKDSWLKFLGIFGLIILLIWTFLITILFGWNSNL